MFNSRSPEAIPTAPAPAPKVYNVRPAGWGRGKLTGPSRLNCEGLPAIGRPSAGVFRLWK